MKKLSGFLSNCLVITLVLALGIAFILIMPNTRVLEQNEPQALQPQDNTQEPTLEATPSADASPTTQAYPYPDSEDATPPLESSPLTEATPYPPPEATQPVLATPMIPTPVVLPPLATYPPIGEFSDMRVVYTKDDPHGYYSNKLDGSDERRFNPFAVFIEKQASGLKSIRVSPDGSKILYSYYDHAAYDKANAMSIWLSDPEGKENQLLVTKQDEWFPEDGIWSPDGKHIAYRRAYLTSSYEEGAHTGSRELWIMNADGTEHRKVLDGPAISNIDIGGSAFVFLWSRNGYIYFATRDDKLYAVNPEDGALYLLLSQVDALLDLYWNFSPDGQHLVPSAKLTDQVIASSGFSPASVSGDVSGWSTDGSKIIYTNNNGIWMRDAYTGQDKLLVSDKDAENPSLSPDNKFLAYQTGDGLFIFDLFSEKVWQVVSDPKTISGNKSVRFGFWIPIK